MLWVSSCVETAKFSATIDVESSTVNGRMPELACSFSGFGQTYIRSSGNTRIKVLCVQNCLKVPCTSLTQKFFRLDDLLPAAAASNVVYGEKKKKKELLESAAASARAGMVIKGLKALI